MKKLCTKGLKVSNEDQLALDHYLLGTAKDWAQGALNGMKNKAVKTILRDYLDIYRSKNETVPTDIAILIPAIIAMPEFKPYGLEAPEKEKAVRKGPKINEVWSGGFDIQDYEEIALKAFYGDPEKVLEDLMENKIAKRKNAFAKEQTTELMRDKTITSIPAHKDDLINFAVARPGYKNRAQKESETAQL